MKLNWVTLRVRDLEKSVAFYTKSLGMETAARFGGAGHEIAMLGQADGPKVELLCDSAAVPAPPGAGVSVGLETEDLDALVASLRAEGYAVSGPIRPNPQFRFFFVSDPDGYTIQLLEQA